jgi:hypothetical protein
MDPNECLRIFSNAEKNFHVKGLVPEAREEYISMMKQAHSSLCDWLQNGGFEPNWSRFGYTRKSFENYFKLMSPRI